MIETVEDLLKAYHDAQLVVVSEYSGDIERETKELDAEVKAVAAELGIAWAGCSCAAYSLEED